MRRYLTVAILVFVFLLSGAVASPTLAAPPDPDEMVLALPMPDFNKLDIPAGMTPETAERYAQQLTYQAASPLLLELEQLQVEGLVAGYTVQPDLHAVVVTGMKPEARARLSRAQELNGIYPSMDALPACAAEAPQALATRLLAQSAVLQNARATSLQATDPSITVYLYASSSYRYGSISGMTAPSTAVTVRVLRRGVEVVRRTTTSSAQGNYYVYPSWQSCPTYGYDFELYSGDVVEVTANGNTVTTVVATLSGWVDPDANAVAGTTDAGRTVNVYLYASTGCTSTNYQLSPAVDTSGNFSANFTALVNFDRRASATIYALDANGNSTYISFSAFRLYGYFDQSYIYGYLKPNVNVQAMLARGGTVTAMVSTQTDERGYFSAYFAQTIQAGDVVTATGGGVTVVYVATEIADLALDAMADQVSGVTTAGRQVRVSAYKRYGMYNHVATACSYSYECVLTTVDGAGAFTATLKTDFARGDQAYVYVYDAQGNYQYHYGYNFPAIVADLSDNYARGYWHRPYVPLLIIVKHSNGDLKATYSGNSAGSDGGFSTWVSMLPGDILEVGDGVVTQTMVVQPLTAMLDADGVSGNADSGGVLAYLYDLNLPSSTTYCAVSEVAGGVYTAPFASAQIGPWDYAYVWNAGPDGHYTMRRPRTFSVEARKENRTLTGYTTLPNTPMTITLLRDGSPVATDTTTSYTSGSWWSTLYATPPVTISQGDTVRVVAGTGSVDILIPALSAQTDGSNNRIYGVAPAGEWVNVSVRRVYNWGWSGYGRSTTVGADGNYSVGFDGLYWYRDCSAVDAGHRCAQAAMDYYTPAGHRINHVGPAPAPVGPDVYEVDDVYTLATPYTGVQSHTFHTITDTDWISFTVSATDIANRVPYQIKTFNLGWNMATQVHIYHANTIVMPLFVATGYENRGMGVDVSWMPPEAGLYYMEISPPSSAYAAYCDAIYDVLILAQRSKIFLPLVLRNH